MSKKKSKNARLRQTLPLVRNSPSDSSVAMVDWESVEADFFARESDLYLVSPVENFDDLD